MKKTSPDFGFWGRLKHLKAMELALPPPPPWPIKMDLTRGCFCSTCGAFVAAPRQHYLGCLGVSAPAILAQYYVVYPDLLGNSWRYVCYTCNWSEDETS
jgi:hypothetical protein